MKRGIVMTDRVPTRSGIREKVGNSVFSFKAGKW